MTAAHADRAGLDPNRLGELHAIQVQPLTCQQRTELLRSLEYSPGEQAAPWKAVPVERSELPWKVAPPMWRRLEGRRGERGRSWNVAPRTGRGPGRYPSEQGKTLKGHPSNPVAPWKVAPANKAEPWKVALLNPASPGKAYPQTQRCAGTRAERGDALEGRPGEPSAALEVRLLEHGVAMERPIGKPGVAPEGRLRERSAAMERHLTELRRHPRRSPRRTRRRLEGRLLKPGTALEGRPGNPASPWNVAPPNVASPSKVAPSNWTVMGIARPSGFRGVLSRIFLRSALEMVTPRASIMPT